MKKTFRKPWENNKNKPRRFFSISLNSILLVILVIICSVCVFYSNNETVETSTEFKKENTEEYIKWMTFDIPVEVLEQAMAYDIKSQKEDYPIDWIELLAYGSAKNWGKFDENKKCKDIDNVVPLLQQGQKMNDLSKDLKLYNYYYETYCSVLNGFVGEFEVAIDDPTNPGEKIIEKRYGLKAYSPIAKGYSYSHYDDFGNSRSYGYKRKHLGNDMMGSVGTPIVAVESGYVEALGWNPYGGWRIGIRSPDNKRYYYYAHLKKDHPFVDGLEVGDYVEAGDVIGYLGMTGYSSTENVNNIKTPHLHFGMQIIFDEVQKDGTNQIWIDVYDIVRLLSKNKMPVAKDAETGDYYPTMEVHSIPTD